MDWSSFAENLLPEGFEALAAAIVVAILSAAVWGFYRIGRYIERLVAGDEIGRLKDSLKEHVSKINELNRSLDAKTNEASNLSIQLERRGGQIRRIRSGVEEGLARPLEETPAWRTRPSGIPIFAIGNLKGGVGKTTLAANLGAYFGDVEARRGAGGRPTLFIDFDFQGSLSTTLIAAGVDFATGDRRSNENRSSALFDPERSDDDRLAIAREIMHPQLAGSRFFDANAELAGVEERRLFEWIFAEDHHAADPRLILGDFLHSAAVQDRFGAVVIDLPPRNTLFAFNALVAANNVVVPTRDDQLSLQAAQTFVNFLELNREALWPRLTIAGLAGVNTTHQPAQNHAVDELLKQAARDLSSIWGGAQAEIPYVGKVPWMRQVAEVAGSDFAYFDTDLNVVAGAPHALFTAIGDEVRENRTL